MRFALLSLLVITGCATKGPQLAAYRWVDTDTALADLRARADAIHNVSAECGITLSRADGETAQFDGAMVMQNPGSLRLRAWKFNRAVFDLTLEPDGLWVMTLDDPAHRKDIVPASANAADFVKQWSWFNGGMFHAPDLQASVEGKTLVLGSSIESRPVRCEVDRETLTPTRYVVGGENESFELQMRRYQLINGELWPMRVIATSKMGKVVIDQRNVEINTELAPNAFVPPRRAERRP